MKLGSHKSLAIYTYILMFKLPGQNSRINSCHGNRVCINGSSNAPCSWVRDVGLFRQNKENSFYLIFFILIKPIVLDTGSMDLVFLAIISWEHLDVKYQGSGNYQDGQWCHIYIFREIKWTHYTIICIDEKSESEICSEILFCSFIPFSWHTSSFNGSNVW